MIVLDASVLIAYLDGEDQHHARAEILLAREIADDFGANSLTLTEVLVAPTRHNRLEAVIAALADLELEELPFPEGTATKLAVLRADTNLTMPDCCVLLAAEHKRARVACFDSRLKAAATARNLIAVDR